MLFNSIEFVIFLTVVIIIYNYLKPNARLYFLLAASYFFYGCWSYKYLGLIFFTSASCFFAGRFIADGRYSRYKKRILLLSLIVNFGILFVFKYFNFFIHTAEGISLSFNHKVQFYTLHVLLPVGISFYTFHSISYVIDVYNDKIPPEKNIFRFLLFVSFFPQLVAGPIARSSSLLPQLQILKNYKYENFRKGFILILGGLFKKVVIADRLAIGVNNVYNHVGQATPLSLLVATFFFTYQVYCDFSGYSDIAIGVAKLFGVDLVINFKKPFLSKNVTEFWRRWHISLSSWFNDYVFTPIVLANRDFGKPAVVFAIMITFSLVGLWHGAGWTFIIFGILQGTVISYELLTKNFRKKLSKKIPNFFYNNLSVVLTFVFISFSMIFFRANSFNEAILIVRKISGFQHVFSDSKKLAEPNVTKALFNMNFYDFAIGLIFIIILAVVEFRFKEIDFVEFILGQSLIKRWIFYIGLTFVILWFGMFGSNQFIYFQF